MRWLSAFRQDLVFAGRLLARSPGSAAAAVACLSIGIGVTTAIYSSLQSLVFRELPAVAAPRELVRFQSPLPYADWEELRDRGGQFATLAAFMGNVPFVIDTASGERTRVWGHLVSPNYFETLGVRPAAGRFFQPNGPDASESQAIISDRLWRGRFGGSPSVVGRLLRLNGQPVTVIGVAAENFMGVAPTLASADLWIPTTAPPSMAPELLNLRTGRSATFDLIGRLAPGRSMAQAEAALEPLVRRLEQIHNDPGKDRKERRVVLLPGGRLYPVRDEDMARAIGLPLVLVGLVLLMACGNVANMLVARAATRRREIAVRLSIGASRGRLVRQLLTESLLLAAMGGAGGILLALWGIHAYRSFGDSMPSYISLDWVFDWRALAFSAGISLVSGLVFGLAPALAATRDDIVSGLKQGSGSALRARRWFSLRNILVGQQVAASVVLLLLTAFIVVGFGGATATGLGFNPRNLYLLSVDPIRDGYDVPRARDYFDRLPQRIERIPGVTSVALTQTLPVAFAGTESLAAAKAELFGGPKALGAIRSDLVGAGFFETAGIPMLRGRAFTRAETDGGSRVIVVNETLASEAWPGQDPIGQRLDFDGQSCQVVGVTRDIRSPMPLAPPSPAAYRPLTPAGFASPSREGVTLMVRVQPGFDAATRLRREMETFDPHVTVFNVRRMDDVVRQYFSLVHFATGIYGGLGAFALILATVGLAGVTAYSVARRTHEIGIRVALGATRRDVLGLVLRESVAIVAVGALAGLAVAFAAMRALSAVLDSLAQATRTSIRDPLVLIGTPALLIVLALVACYVPARKSTRIDASSALRME